MNESFEAAANEKYRGRFVVVEVGGAGHREEHDMSLMNHLAIDPEKHPLYINIDDRPDNLKKVPGVGAPSVAVQQGDIFSGRFLYDRDLDGSVDRFILFNVLSENVRQMVEASLPSLSLKIASMLKEGGKAFIGEWYTPDKVSEITQFDFERYGLRKSVFRDGEAVRRELGELGVSEQKVETIIRDFNACSEMGAHPFLIVLTNS